MPNDTAKDSSQLSNNGEQRLSKKRKITSMPVFYKSHSGDQILDYNN